MRVLANPLADPAYEAAPDRRPLAFHRTLPGYRPTPLRDAPAAAARLGVGRVLVKDESDRLGLPAFKVLGASWAAYRALAGREAGALTLADLRERLAGAPRLVAATDGNHGRAVARIAAWLGLPARIYVPAGVTEARRAAIADEGAEVVVVEDGYDAAVVRAAAEHGDGALVVSDTGWEGYEDIPRWVAEGYSTMLWEVDDALDAAGAPPPGAVAVQMGVGALASAVIGHWRRPGAGPRPTIAGVEPVDAACVLAGLEHGAPAPLAGPQRSIMGGLNCGLASPVAWHSVSRGLDVAIAVEDAHAEDAVRVLAEDGIVAGETGAAGLAGLLAAGSAVPGLGPGATVLVIVTEGATDAAAYRRIVGSRPV